MFPDMTDAFDDLGETIQMQKISKLPVDFEVEEVPVDQGYFEAVLQPMPEQKVNRKPEGDREWMWWSAWTEKDLQLDDKVQDEEGRVFKVATKANWGQAGFFEYGLTEQPV